ncbi:MAG TPA: glycosyltransferase family 39 protein [Opitutaceae bacterium]|nr:glycosyltransferase family 39 protein [Opitutaceae bacterium]
MTTSDNTVEAPRADGPGGGNWHGILTGRTAAAGVLLLFWLLMAASLRDKSLTYDEVAYAAAGYAQWHYGDFRLQPENGQLPERMAGLALELGLSPLPEPDPAAWKDADQWGIGGQWLYRSGRDAGALGAMGRMCCGLFAVALGALLWAWARSLFGPAGGMVSLLLFVMDPTILANGALMTSDTATALFLAGSTWAIWALLGRLTPGRLLLSAILVGALLLTKVSALLIGPVALLLAGARLADARPLPFSIGPFRGELAPRSRRLVALAGVALLHALVAVGLIWACYGFRYSAAPASDPSGRFRIPWERLLAKPEPSRALQALDLSDSQLVRARSILDLHGAAQSPWTNGAVDAVEEIRRDVLTQEQGRRLDAFLSLPSPVFWVRLVELARGHRLLPEAWIYGLTDVYRRAQVRVAFLNGSFRLRGWHLFFPYTFLVKTPLALFGVILLAAAGIPGLRREGVVRNGGPVWRRGTLPVWALLSVYWAAAVASHLNIGHRHLLPAYAPLFVLCGAAGLWFDALGRPPGAAGRSRRVARAGACALGALLIVLAAGTVWSFPNYLAYFNGIVRPSDGYRHLVDSSLDWGQDLPAARDYVERRAGADGPFYFSYFGSASPDYYGIHADYLYSVDGMDWLRRPDWETVLMAPGDVEAALPRLRRDWPDHELLGLQRVGESVAAALLKSPERLGLRAGTYLISASMLQPVNYALGGPWGPWNGRYEAAYQELRAAVKPLMSAGGGDRMAAIARRSVGEWPPLLRRFEEYRFARLTAYLRHRKPDDEINYSILVYRLSDADIARALDGLPAELAPDEQSGELRELPGPGPG